MICIQQPPPTLFYLSSSIIKDENHRNNTSEMKAKKSKSTMTLHTSLMVVHVHVLDMAVFPYILSYDSICHTGTAHCTCSSFVFFICNLTNQRLLPATSDSAHLTPINNGHDANNSTGAYSTNNIAHLSFLMHQ